MKAQTALFLAILTAAAHAGPLRTSANYSIPTDTTDSGGKKTASSSYSIDTSIGGVTGIATFGPPASPTETTKTGYIAQLYEVTGLVLNAAPLTINEGGTRQLSAWQTLDDATFLAVPATSVIWSIVDGPLTSISSSGLVMAGIVYEATNARVQGAYAGNTSPPLTLTVLDTIPDNFGTYAGDGVGDDWQVQYFGPPPNPIAGPNADPDGDGQNNRFEWIAGLIPTDASSAFKLSIVRNAGNAVMVFGPTVAGRTYAVKYGFDFLNVANWPTLPGGVTTDVGTQRFVTDPNAVVAGPKKYYRVEIAK